ncbi:YgaP-like transmembrane domain [Agriterribacter sp.]|uniref:YgaP-like transmembrane domain n=1 Tax=Agriterribacter sp. TaxID=2821509 RepID=UPI002C221769|nr:YgaP-like transmembrane domain [Agriterribacter sp.]HRO47877.1 DUF2892 domain-containing protein [Agriterribacter sp.]HRQ18827.1 DUF2892 domain-containing protein [Agriterribacter sp.]
MPNTRSSKNVIWFSRLLRWGLGIAFMVTGFLYYKEGGWPALLFGVLLFVTGFLRPKRCIAESCDLPSADDR